MLVCIMLIMMLIVLATHRQMSEEDGECECDEEKKISSTHRDWYGVRKRRLDITFIRVSHAHIFFAQSAMNTSPSRLIPFLVESGSSIDSTSQHDYIALLSNRLVYYDLLCV